MRWDLLEAANGFLWLYGNPRMKIDIETLDATQFDADRVYGRSPSDAARIREILGVERFGAVVVDRVRSRLYAAGTEGILEVFDWESGDSIAEIETTAGHLRVIEMLPDGSRLFVAGGDPTIRIIDPDSLQMVAVLRGHRDKVVDLAISPDGSTIYSASDDYTVRAWSTSQPTR